jgi:flagellar basal-body rod protein FlgB
MDSAKVDLLKSAMTAYVWRSKAIASNLANLDSPGYQRMSVSFEEEMSRALHSRRERDLEIAPTLNTEGGTPLLEDELMELADTQMRTQMATRALRDHFAMVRMSISGRTG